MFAELIDIATDSPLCFSDLDKILHFNCWLALLPRVVPLAHFPEPGSNGGFMKKVLSGFALLLATLSPFALNVHAQESAALNDVVIKSLTKTATTPAQHRRIAAYYRQKSEALRARSREHLTSAEVRAKNPRFAALETKHGFAFGLGASHCRYLANADAASAKLAETLALQHEDMAVRAELGGSIREVAEGRF